MQIARQRWLWNIAIGEVVSDGQEKGGRRVTFQCADEVVLADVTQDFIGIERQHPWATGVLEVDVPRGREVTGPTGMNDFGSERPRNFRRVVVRARINNDQLVAKPGDRS